MKKALVNIVVAVIVFSLHLPSKISPFKWLLELPEPEDRPE